ncbi:HlyD family efflux transporter periplasmic adaptor subunit [Rhizobium rhizogenes]|jgi:membrane fusion protein|uniref:HlyD family secretion protein n=1 Tax=Rhizobium rhizogenes TaxID=359 RepID=UPI0009B89261|nr:HlyD family efflux transporter periplasmic adaptor subunit [Rhizobium rhizogenes]
MSEGPSLFRRESLEARDLAWLGQPTVLRSIPTTAVAIVSAVIAVAIVLLLVFGNYTRRVRVSGVMLPTEGLTRIAAPGSGWLTQQFVKDGERVLSGAPLYVVSFDSTTSLGNTQDVINQLLRTKRDELRAEIDRREKMVVKEKDSLQNQQENLTREIKQADYQIDLAEQFTKTLLDYAESQKNLMTQGISISQQFESRLQSYMIQKVNLESLRKQRIELDSELSKVHDQLASFELRSASEIGEWSRQLVDIERQIADGESRRAIQITAPRSGVITSVITQVGQTVSTGTPLLTIMPDDAELEAQLLAPSDAIGFLHEGEKVLLRYAAFPYQKFGQYAGVVSQISRAPLRQDEMKLLVDGGAAVPSSTGVYRVTVRPASPVVTTYARKVPLQAGMQVEAHILVETRPLYQWVFEPLYGLSEMLTSSGTKQ